MSATSIPGVRAALVERFTAALAAAGDVDTVVTYGHPGEQIPEQCVAVVDTVNGVRRDQKRMPMSTRAMTEEYELRVVVWVKASAEWDSEVQKAVTVRSWAIVDVLDAALREDYTLDKQVTWALFTGFDDADFNLGEGRASEIIATVTVRKSQA